MRKPQIVISLVLVALGAASFLHAQSRRPPDRDFNARPQDAVDKDSLDLLFGNAVISNSPFENDTAKRTQQLAQRDKHLTRVNRGLQADFSKSTDDKKKQETAAKLKRSLTEHFEVKQELREMQLVELEARVKRLRELHDRRNSAKATIIEKRFNHMIDEAEGVGWNISNGQNNAGTNSSWTSDLGTADDTFVPR